MNGEICEPIKEEKKYLIFIGGQKEHIDSEKVCIITAYKNHPIFKIFILISTKSKNDQLKP